MNKLTNETMQIHPTAVIAKDVILGVNVIIHPYVVIESGVTIGDNVEIFPFAYIGKEPKGAGVLSRQPVFQKQLFIGSNCSIGPHTTIYYDVRIGKNTLIGDNTSIREQVTIGENCLISRNVTINYNTIIGNKTKIMDLSHITGNCVIGNEVFISAMVATANNNNVGYLREYSADSTKGQIIEDKATIGLGAKLLPNIRIGKGAMVGAGAVVTKDVLSETLVMGVPARITRSLLKDEVLLPK